MEKRGGVSPIRGDALIAVDLQNDFVQGGRLAVRGGEQVIPVFNSYLELFRTQGLPVFVTRDWHPRDHVSFTSQGGTWPPHCVQGTLGAQFVPDLALAGSEVVISKADSKNADSYSNFENTDLADRLRKAGIGRLFIGGLATDYCVGSTVLDALNGGFEVVLLTDVIQAVNVQPGDGERAVEEMISKGARPAGYRDLAA